MKNENCPDGRFFFCSLHYYSQPHKKYRQIRQACLEESVCYFYVTGISHSAHISKMQSCAAATASLMADFAHVGGAAVNSFTFYTQSYLQQNRLYPITNSARAIMTVRTSLCRKIARSIPAPSTNIVYPIRRFIHSSYSFKKTYTCFSICLLVLLRPAAPSGSMCTYGSVQPDEPTPAAPHPTGYCSSPLLPLSSHPHPYPLWLSFLSWM